MKHAPRGPAGGEILCILPASPAGIGHAQVGAEGPTDTEAPPSWGVGQRRRCALQRLPVSQAIINSPRSPSRAIRSFNSASRSSWRTLSLLSFKIRDTASRVNSVPSRIPKRRSMM